MESRATRISGSGTVRRCFTVHPFRETSEWFDTETAPKETGGMAQRGVWRYRFLGYPRYLPIRGLYETTHRVCAARDRRSPRSCGHRVSQGARQAQPAGAPSHRTSPSRSSSTGSSPEATSRTASRRSRTGGSTAASRSPSANGSWRFTCRCRSRRRSPSHCRERTRRASGPCSALNRQTPPPASVRCGLDDEFLVGLEGVGAAVHAGRLQSSPRVGRRRPDRAGPATSGSPGSCRGAARASAGGP